jgi:hypothetical protein
MKKKMDKAEKEIKHLKKDCRHFEKVESKA